MSIVGAHRLFLILACAIASATQTPAAHANGKYFAHLAVAEDPSIPSQRAVLVWRDGVETLVIESIVQAEGEALGWILPLPNLPTSIEPSTPGALQAMAELVSPVMHGKRTRNDWLKLSAMALVLSVLVSLAMIGAKKRVGWIVAGGSIFGIFLCAGLILPALGAARGGITVPNVEVKQISRVGNFDVTVIQAVDGTAALRWLQENEFSHDERAKAVLNDYADEGWCFAVAKLATEGSRTLSPHPLNFTFPAANPVYPMRLTGVTSEPLLLDLFIVAERRASATGMRPWLSDSFRLKADHANAAGEFVSIYAANQYSDVAIGHPEITKHLWDGCQLTRLRGTLLPNQMSEDISLNWHSPTSSRHEIYSKPAAIGRSFGLAMLGLAACLPVFTGLQLRSATWNRVSARTALGLFVLVALIGGLAFVTSDIHMMNESREAWFLRQWPRLTFKDLRKLSATRESWTRDLLETEVRTSLEAFLRTAEDFNLAHLDKPNGFSLAETDPELILTVYDKFASPSSIRFPKSSPPAE